MNSVLIEYLRFNNLNTGVLRGGEPYILAHKNLPVRQVFTPVEQYDLLEKLGDCMRYHSEISNSDKWKTIIEISNQIKELFIDIQEFGYSNCQFDVVLNASELCLLPFELLLDDQEVPWFASAAKKISFTRRIRQSHLENTFSWPYTPRVLFIYSHGGFAQVPFDRHLNGFDYALKKWGGTSNEKVFRMLEQPSYHEIVTILKENDAPEKQFTHVHILAHGALIQDKLKPQNFEFGIMFGKGEENPTTTQSIKELFESLETKPFVVNYMICDGANFSNPLKPDKNPVQVTHRSGVPIVLGSQYPLSMEGSTRITNKLYAALFDGNDIREILCDIRQDLFKRKDEHHDWISFVSYVRLPEGYEDYLFKLALYCEMQNLRYVRKETDSYFVQNAIINEDTFEESLGILARSISSLEKKLSEIEGNPKYWEDTLENLGLLGSANKRLAELSFLRDKLFKDAIPDSDKGIQRSELQKSLDYYKKGCDRNLSHHWSLVQFLSLDTALNGRITDSDYWFAAKRAIQTAITLNKNDGWAYGSLMELYLLDPRGKDSSFKTDIDMAVDKLIAIAKEKQNPFLLESTSAQISRYQTWWRPENGYFISPDLLVADMVLLEQINGRISEGIKKI
ncbi:MAG TPA: hypothetical protein VFN95_03925 [Flavitalea sp.]|nr:hypothetical protein [Flavitalea sp.]